jgi:hypothetical protein
LRIRTVPVLITDTAVTASADPGPALELAVEAVMAGILFPHWAPPAILRAGPTQAPAA